MAEFKGKILENRLTGLVMTINDQEVHFRLIGEFNAYNLLAVYGAAVCLGEDKQEVLRCLSEITGAEGRFDYIISPNPEDNRYCRLCPHAGCIAERVGHNKKIARRT